MTSHIVPRLAALAGGLLMATAPAHAGLLNNIGKTKASTPVVIEPGTDLAAKAGEMTLVQKPEKIAGHTRYALTGFTVEFQTMARDSDIQFGSTKSSNVKLHMEGVSQADMQAITDQVYAHFLEQMKAQGIELVLPADLAFNPDWESIAKMGKGPSYEMTGENDKLLMLAPTGRTLIYPHPDEQAARLAWGVSGLRGLAQGTLPQAEIKLAKGLGMPLMKVHYVVKFGGASALVTTGATKQTAKVGGLILGDGQSALSIRTEKDSPLPAMSTREGGMEDGDAFVRLKTSIASPVEILAGEMRKTNAASNAAGNAMAMLTGAGGMASEWTAPLDPAKYAEFANGSLNAVTDLLAAQLKATVQQR